MIDIGIKTIGFFIAVFSFSVLINSPRKYLLWAGIAGAGIGVYLYYLCGDWMESSDCFILVCFGGRPYIPYIRKDSESSCHDVSDWWNFADSAGNGIYQIMNSMLQNDRVMTGYYLTQTIEIAGAIALAIF